MTSQRSRPLDSKCQQFISFDICAKSCHNTQMHPWIMTNSFVPVGHTDLDLKFRRGVPEVSPPQLWDIWVRKPPKCNGKSLRSPACKSKTKTVRASFQMACLHPEPADTQCWPFCCWEEPSWASSCAAGIISRQWSWQKWAKLQKQCGWGWDVPVKEGTLLQQQ